MSHAKALDWVLAARRFQALTWEMGKVSPHMSHVLRTLVEAQTRVMRDHRITLKEITEAESKEEEG